MRPHASCRGAARVHLVMSAAMRLRPLTAVLIVAVSVAIVALAACHVESAPTVVAPPPLPPLPPPLPPLPNQPPVADAGGPYTGGDTAAIAFDGTRSFDPDDDLPLDYTWDFGDGNTAIGARRRTHMPRPASTASRS